MPSISKKRTIYIDYQDLENIKSPLIEGLKFNGNGFRSWFLSKSKMKQAACDDEWKANEWRLEFEYILKRLEPLEKIIMKFLVNGMTQEEIAQQLDITQQAVSKRLTTIIEKCKKFK